MRRIACVSIVLVAVGGCRWMKRPSAPSAGAADASRPGAAESASPARGVVRNGTYTDSVWGYSIPVPVGWQWLEGPDPGSLRLRATDPSTGTTIEVWHFPGHDLQPRPRDGCTWQFYDHGPYLGPGRHDRRSVATCVPHDASRHRIFAWMLPGSDAGVWQIEGGVLPEHLVRGDDLVRSIVEQFELIDRVDPG